MSLRATMPTPPVVLPAPVVMAGARKPRQPRSARPLSSCGMRSAAAWCSWRATTTRPGHSAVSRFLSGPALSPFAE
eukprot:9379372-Pyramimonas_sp.AAC.1